MAGAFIAGVALLAYGLLVGACVWHAISMLLEKSLSPLEFTLYLGVFLGAAMGAIGSLGTPLFPVLLLAAILLPIALPLGTWLVDKLKLERMRLEDIARYQTALEKRPDIPYYARKLGDIFYGSEDWALAKQYYERYQKKSGDKKIRHRIRRCEELLQAGKGQPNVCPNCGTPNPRDARFCIKCNKPLPGLWEIIEVFRARGGMSILLWGIAGATLIGLVLSFVQLLHPIYAAFFWLLVIVGLFVYIFIKVSSK